MCCHVYRFEHIRVCVYREILAARCLDVNLLVGHFDGVGLMRFFCHSKNRRVTEVSGIFVWTRTIGLNVYASPSISEDEQTRREGMTTQELSSEEFVITSLVEPCLTLSAVSLMLMLKIRYLPILGLVARNVLKIRTVIASGRNAGETDKPAFQPVLSVNNERRDDNLCLGER